MSMPIGSLVNSWHDGSFLPLTTFPRARFTLGCFAVVGDIAFQAAQGRVPTKSLEIHFGVVMRRPDTDGRVAELVKIPLRSILFPQRVGLVIRETCVAVRGQVSAPRETGFARRDEKRPRRWGTTRCQILVQQCADGTREKHFAGSVAFALDENGAIRPGNILNVDSQGFLATQTPS